MRWDLKGQGGVGPRNEQTPMRNATLDEKQKSESISSGNDSQFAIEHGPFIVERARDRDFP